ncbi:MAG: chemotaxis protein CheW [gamma proteobacterium symbiont of Bathyaustriella thionipta]|nr:chemotaxis protein CheW [gamma proteobacterium symbiont of Bathyaustriella thionipta]MCU7950341.1 chemotaxis protein CheW [gamma proteobacterium symbiont of Bathyaustriella thionipta]MCU7952962.1 chemotaxis protein CheW [gamma proteobacterium symbiont of Bathyaustriella thionipta]MCU7956871.1 chemotaxis protein CheW [gamma proteobacterium symbiont of Bathyaustriella thionipta]MCU7967224.1 chemotaxis protein CheW [gamma proteobacterium symbiont of Bathyaustriella thionipta]
MSDEPHNDNLLVDQNDALDFYFDSLLLPEENDSLTEDSDTSAQDNEFNFVEKPVSEKQPVQDDVKKTKFQNNKEPADPAELLQSAKDFLRISRQRQKNNAKQATQDEFQPQSSQITETSLKTESVVTQTPKVITKGPLSPKPRESQLKDTSFASTEIASIKAGEKQSIVFSNKNNDGKESDQVLIPRSQRLASLKQMNQDNKDKGFKYVARKEIKTASEPEKKLENRIISKTISSNGTLETHKLQPNHNLAEAETHLAKSSDLAPQATPVEKKQVEVTSNTLEAPNLDLSLFLPEIKTLTDTEIAQQIEALTQAAMSQAQLKSDVAQAAQTQQMSKTQADSDNGLIRNIENAPPWAVPDFQVLLFTVAGLKMAVPLNELNGIVEWGDEYITELPGHKSWYLGIIQNQGKNVPVIDTLQQVVPQNRWPAEYLTKKDFKHIILIDNSRLGLACETVLEVVTLKTDSVKWRSSRTKRRWLLGTVIDHMCALLDSSEFAAMLKTGDDSLVS